MEHIIVWERETGVDVPANCCIHHLNGDKLDNRISNLCMMQFNAHTAYHNTGTELTEETRSKISEKAKMRFTSKDAHPSYKDIDMDRVMQLRRDGHTVAEVCRMFNISKKTYYNKMEDIKNA